MHRRLTWIPALAAAAALALAGCSGPATGPEPTVELDETAVITIASQNAVTNWDPAQSVGGPEIGMLKLVYDALVGMSPEMTPEPLLAVSWEASDDAREWTFTLREGVEYSDGTPFDAEVVKANIERYQTHSGSTLAPAIAHIEEIVVLDPLTVRFVLARADVALPALLSERYGMMPSPASFVDGRIAEPVGTGQFVWVEEQQTVSLTLAKNETSWRADDVHIAGVEVLVMDDAIARFNAFRTGVADLTLVSPDQVEEAMTLPGVQLYSQTLRASRFISINAALYEPFQDPRVRLALNLAIDREGIVEGLLFGQGEPAYQMRPEALAGFNPDLRVSWPYDPERARELLDEAGYETLEFDFVVVPRFTTEAEAIRSAWAEIGVNITVTPLAGAGAGQALWYEKTAAAGLTGFDGSLDLGLAYTSLFGKTAVKNTGQLVDPRLDELMTQAMAETDLDKRAALFVEMSEVLAANPLSNWPVVYGYDGVVSQEKIVGLSAYQDSFPRLEGVGVLAG
jgi:ABC-type dipeptide transport system, periplasmic component